MKYHKFIPFAVALFLTTVSTLYAVETIRYTGSSTVGLFIKKAADVYAKAVFDINTEPESGGGETATVYGKTDIGGVAREVKEEILSKGVKKYLIGKDAIGVWVHGENPVRSLLPEQLKMIFTGKISNWKEVGGPDIPMHIYIVNPQSATRIVFKNSILGEDDYSGDNIETVRPDPAILDKVASYPGGIGQLSFALGADHPLRAKVRKISIGPQEASVNNPDYPITRPLYLITKGEAEGKEKEFIQWALSDEGQAVVKKYFVGAR